MQVDLRVAELLCSRLCHDLVGPAGAVNAGLELLQEGGENGAGALDLMGRSAAQMARRLEFYRAAFGQGGLLDERSPFARARELAAAFLSGGIVRLDWPPAEDARFAGRLPVGSAKLVLNAILVGVDCLPRGGVVQVRLADLGEGAGIAITSCGRGAAVRGDLRAAMEKDVSVEDLSARTIHGHFARLVAEAIGATIEWSALADGEVGLALVVPFVSPAAAAGRETAAAKRVL